MSKARRAYYQRRLDMEKSIRTVCAGRTAEEIEAALALYDNREKLGIKLTKDGVPYTSIPSDSQSLFCLARDFYDEEEPLRVLPCHTPLDSDEWNMCVSEEWELLMDDGESERYHIQSVWSTKEAATAALALLAEKEDGK